MKEACQRFSFADVWRLYEFFRRRSIFPGYNTFYALIMAAVSSSNASRAVELLSDMQDLVASPMQPSLVLYCSVISALGRDKRRASSGRSLAYTLWKDLRGSGLQLDAAAYRAGINACVDVGRLQEARELVQKLIATHRADVDARPFNMLLKGYSRQLTAPGRGGSGPGGVEGGESGGPEATAPTRQQVQLQLQVKNLLSEMRRLDVQPTLHTYNHVIDAFIRAGSLADASAALQDMQAAGFRPDRVAFNTLIKGYCQEAIRARPPPAAASRRTVLQSDAERRAGEEVQEEAEGARPSSPVAAPAAAAAVGQAWGPAVLLQLANVEEALLSMEAVGVSPDEVTFGLVMNVYVELGDLARAKSLLEQAVAAGLATPTHFNTLLKGFGRSSAPEDLEAALAVLEDMAACDVPPSLETYNVLIEAAARQEDVASAVRVFRRISRDGLRPDAFSYASLAKGFLSAHLLEEAVRVVDEALASPSVQLDVPTLCLAVDVYARSARMDQAKRALDAAQQLARSLRAPVPIKAFTPLIFTFAKQRRVEEALEYTRRFLEAGGEADDVLIDILIGLCVRTGEFRRALGLVQAMERSGRVINKEKVRKLMRALDATQRELYGEALGARRPRSASEVSRNDELERFKFWLGLPNSYYGDRESASAGQGPSSSASSPSPTGSEGNSKPSESNGTGRSTRGWGAPRARRAEL